MKQVSPPESTLTETAGISKLGKQRRGEQVNYTEAENMLDCRQAILMPNGWKDETPFVESILLQFTQNEELTVNYEDRKLELHTTSASACLQAYLMPNDHRTILISTYVDIMFLGA